MTNRGNGLLSKCSANFNMAFTFVHVIENISNVVQIAEISLCRQQ